KLPNRTSQLERHHIVVRYSIRFKYSSFFRSKCTSLSTFTPLLSLLSYLLHLFVSTHSLPNLFLNSLTALSVSEAKKICLQLYFFINFSVSFINSSVVG